MTSLAEIRRDASQYDWGVTNGRAALVCLPVIVGLVFAGIITGDHEWAVLAVAGAVAVGFAAFQQLARGYFWPMFAMLVGIAACTWIGSVAIFVGWPALAIVATLLGYAFGVITTIGYGAWWIGLQWMIALLVYGAHGATPRVASANAIAAVAGGAAELAWLMLVLPWTDQWFRRQDQVPWNVRESLLLALREHARPNTPPGRYAIRVAVALMVTTTISHFWAMPNGYWAPMTAAILLRPNVHETAVRGVNRLTGTLAGAGITTLLLVWWQPGETLLGVLLLLSVWGCFALQRVNYGIYAVCITGYVVFLFALVGLPQPVVALHRVEATLVGAAVALLVHIIPLEPVIQSSLNGQGDS